MKTLNKVIHTYFRFALFRINLKLSHDKLRRLGAGITGRLLDIGAGHQPYRRHFPDVSNTVTTNALRFYPEDALPALATHTSVWSEDATQLPFRDDSFDAVLCCQVLSVIEDPEAFFQETLRVLKPGGTLLLTTDFLYPKWSSADVFRYTDRGLRNLAEQAGLDVEQVESYGGFHTMTHSLATRYIQEYPQYVRAANCPICKVFMTLVFLIYLAGAPLLSLLGWGIYLLERGQRHSHTFTVNNLLIARKP